MSGAPGHPSVDRPMKVRACLVAAIVTLAFAGLAGKIAEIQIIHRDRWLGHALAGRFSREETPGHRGDILSSDGRILARSLPGWRLAVDPLAADRVEELVRAVAREASLGPEDTARYLALARDRRGQGVRYLPIPEVTDPGVIDRCRGISPAVIKERVFRRVYPLGALGHEVVGEEWSGRGVFGVEKAWDFELSGKPGVRVSCRDALGLEGDGATGDRGGWRYPGPGSIDIPPVAPYNLVLSIDTRVQRICEDALLRACHVERARAGSAVVLDVRNGDIVAMANVPGLDPSRPRRETVGDAFNRALLYEYEPGSTIKPFVMAGALLSGRFSLSEVIYDGDRFHTLPSGRTIEDVSSRHYPIRLLDAVVFSSNIAMTRIGLRMGEERLQDVLERFALGVPTGTRFFPSEASGRRPDRWSHWTVESVSFGYEIRVTLVQLARAFACFANGGSLVRPRLVKRMVRAGPDGEEVREVPPVVVRRALSDPVVLERMHETLARVVREGTGRDPADPLGTLFPFAGKTGTTTKWENGYVAGKYYTSFVAFAPLERPLYVVALMVDEPRVHRYGGQVAAPAVREILRGIFNVDAPVEG